MTMTVDMIEKDLKAMKIGMSNGPEEIPAKTFEIWTNEIKINSGFSFHSVY